MWPSSSARTFWLKLVKSVASRWLMAPIRFLAVVVQLGAGAHEVRVVEPGQPLLLGGEAFFSSDS